MSYQKQTILIVDDEPANLDILKELLGLRYKVKIAVKGKSALKIVEKQLPDLILLDIMMLDMDGYEVCCRLKANPKFVNIPVIFVTAMIDVTEEHKGLELGAVDFITKPFHLEIVEARVKTHLALANQKREVEKMVRLRTEELEKSQQDAVNMLGRAGHYNDTDTGIDIWRMTNFSAALAQAACWSVKQADLLRMAAPLHDTGKIGIFFKFHG